MILIVDNYDSFTLNLAEYFHKLGKETLVLRNDLELSEYTKIEIEAVVFSPGPQLPKDANKLMDLIHLFEGKLPLLGICLGHQALNEYFGGTLKKLPEPKHGKVSKINHVETGIYKGFEQNIKVVRYHSWCIDKLAENFEVTATSLDDTSIMSIQHKNKKITGIQYHPESILTNKGIDFLKNWLIMSGIS